VITRGAASIAGRVAVAAALVLPDLDGSASAQTTGLSYAFGAPPIAPAGSLGPNQTVTFALKVRNNGVADPGGPVFLSYTTPASGDSLTVPSGACTGTTTLSSTPVLCTANSAGEVSLTYKAPATPPGEDVVLFTAGNTPTNPSITAVNHYLYSTNYRFTTSPIAAPGSLADNASVAVSLSAENASDLGIPNDTVFLSFDPASGGGSARITGGAALTRTPTLYQTSSSGLLSLTYTAPANRPSTGIDSIVAQDLKSSPKDTNSDSYAFSSSAPVISIGDSTIVEGDVQPGTPADFTVTIHPVQTTATTVQYTTLCGLGDKGCEEDYVEVLTPATVTIPAGASSTKILLRQFAYVGNNAGETYAEGWYIHLVNPSAGVLGRSVGEGVLLPDLENGKTVITDLYCGGAGLVPTPGSNEPVYFTVTLGAPMRTAVTFNYATSDGTALAGRDYVAASGTTTIAAGSTSAVISVSLLADSPPSVNRTFTFTISDASGGVPIYTPTGTGTVLAG
jgi:hypothetical protein